MAESMRYMTAPNPCVGAVLVKDGVIVAAGRHLGKGQPHAEVEALADAAAKGIDPASCTLVVTLEPCAHTGRTPPCTTAIEQAGIRHVVIGALDPNPEARGGAELLRRRGVRVETGILRGICEDLVYDFTIWQTTRLPFTLVKLAATLDGRIATRTGHSKWITGPEARRTVQELRRHAGAIIVGGNTFYQDDPQLTRRSADGRLMPGEQPLAVVVTSRLPAVDFPRFLLRERPTETIFWTSVAEAAGPKAKALRNAGIRVFGLRSCFHPAAEGEGMRADMDLAEGLADLREQHACSYVLCEGGGRLGLSFLRKGLAHEVHLHLAPRIMGDNEAVALFDGLRPLRIEQALSLRFLRTEVCGNDLMLSLRPLDAGNAITSGNEG